MGEAAMQGVNDEDTANPELEEPSYMDEDVY